MADELEKMQRALNQSYADRDRIASDLDKVRDDLERSQVRKYFSNMVHSNTYVLHRLLLANIRFKRKRHSRNWIKHNRNLTGCKRNSKDHRTKFAR